MDKWNPWKVTALAMALVMATALVTGLVVANWSGSELAQPAPGPAAETERREAGTFPDRSGHPVSAGDPDERSRRRL
jgi:hypothetical protein